MMSTQEDAEQRNLDLVLNTVNSISLVGAVLVMSTVAISSYFQSTAAKRLSFRLSMWIALADFVFCGLSYLNIAVEEVMECNVITGLGYIANLTYIFLTVCMAFNLQMVFVQQQHNPRWSEGFYVMASFGAACAIVIPFTAVAMSLGECTLFGVVDLPYNVLVFWMILGIWEAVGIIYCSITIIKVVLKLTRFHHNNLTGGGRPNHYNPNNPTNHRVSYTIQNKVAQVVRRLVFYPLIPVITQTPYIIAANLSLIHLGEKSLMERYIYYVPSYSAGLLNAVVFLFDPALPEIYKDFQNYALREYSPPLEQGAGWWTRLIAPVMVKFVREDLDESMSRHSKSQSLFQSGFVLVPSVPQSEKTKQMLSSPLPQPPTLPAYPAYTPPSSPPVLTLSPTPPLLPQPSFLNPIITTTVSPSIVPTSPHPSHHTQPLPHHPQQHQHHDSDLPTNLTANQFTLLL